MKARAEAMLIVEEALAGLSKDDQEVIAFDIWRTFGGNGFVQRSRSADNDSVQRFVAPDNDSVQRNGSKAATKSPTPPALVSRSKSLSGEDQALRDKAGQVLEFLNRKAGKTFRGVGGTLKPIVARLREGYTVEDCQLIVARKTMQWANDSVMKTFLRPKTLFSSENFANYLGEGKPQ